VLFIALKGALYSSSLEPVSELRGVTCHMGKHSITLVGDVA